MERKEHNIYDVIACMDQAQAALLMCMEHIDLHSKNDLDHETRKFLNDTYSVLAMIRNSIRNEVDIISDQETIKG